MKAAVISLTENGRVVSERIAGANICDTARYCLAKHCDDGAESFTDIEALTAELFGAFDALIFVCACGIAVRMTAPHIRSKQTDPAVIVVDDRGSFVIPILSGHLGGANAIAVRIAERIGAQAVVTTATDIGGSFSPDSFARANGLIIDDMDAAKAVAAAVLEGEPIGLVSEYECANIPDGLTVGEEARIGVYIGADRQKAPFPVTLRLIPKNIVLGIGCKRGTSAEAIVRAVLESGIDIERVCAVSTIDIKSDEPGLLEFCAGRGLELFTYTADELMSVSGDFGGSEFVRSVTGADNVCERSAVLCSGGRLVREKYAAHGVTAAAAEKPLVIDFERKII